MVATARPKYVLRVVGHVDGFTVAGAIIELHKMAEKELPDGSRPTFATLARFLNVSESTLRRYYRSRLQSDGNKGRERMRLGTVPDSESVNKSLLKLVEDGYKACIEEISKEMYNLFADDKYKFKDVHRELHMNSLKDMDSVQQMFQRANELRYTALSEFSFFKSEKLAEKSFNK